MKTRDLAARKRVIDLLKKKCLKTEELSTEAQVPIRTLWRILGELQTFGLADKKDGLWIWCKDIKSWQGNPVMYDIAIKHAKDLLPGFLALAEDYPQGRYQDTGDNKYVSPEQAEELKEFAESHLKTAPSYQPIYNKLIEFRRLKSKFNELYNGKVEKIWQGLRRKILTSNDFQVGEPKKKPSKSWFRKLFPEVIFANRDIPYVLGPFDAKQEIFDALSVYNIVSTGLLFQTDKTKKWYVLGPLAVSVDSHKTLKKFDDFIQTKEEKINVSGDLKREIHMLKLRIDHGQPLDEDSHCKICPNIIIKEEDSKKA